MVTGKVSRGFLGGLLDGACAAAFSSGGCCDDSRSAIWGIPEGGILRAGLLSEGVAGLLDRTFPAIIVLLLLFAELAAATFGAWAACFNRSATVGIRLPAISLRIPNISAHFSR